MSPLERYGRQIREINRLESQLSMPFYHLAVKKRLELCEKVKEECGAEAWDEVRQALQEPT